MAAADASSTSDHRLKPAERWSAAVAAGVIGVVAYLLLADPPSVEKVAPDKACRAAQCTVSVAVDTTTIVTALFLLAGAAALIALLGVRFTKVSAGSVSLEGTSVTDVTQHAGGKAGQALAAAAAPPDSDGWTVLPAWAQTALRDWADETQLVTRGLRTAVQRAAKDPRQGNRAWYVDVRLDSDETKTLRLSIGRGSSGSPE